MKKLKSFLVSCVDLINGFKIARIIFRKKPIILMYHRIVNSTLVPGIDPLIFEQQIRYLKKYFTVMNMNTFMQAQANNSVPDNTVVLTFDDGHEDFYTTAWPILKSYKVPATLFITTGFVDQNCWLWPDLLRYILINSTSVTVDLDNIGQFDLSEESVLKTWNTLGDYCLSLSSAERSVFINMLSKKLNVKFAKQALTPFGSVSWDNLREMRDEGLDVGSHTVTHPILSHLTPEELEYELVTSKTRIETELGFSPIGICYPNGMAKDVSSLVEQRAQAQYQYGLVAYPAEISMVHPMRIGRYGSSNNFSDFKLIVSQLTRNNNNSGEYK